MIYFQRVVGKTRFGYRLIGLSIRAKKGNSVQMKRLLRYLIIVLVLGGLVVTGSTMNSRAQEPQPPQPLAQGAQPLSQVAVLEMPSVDVAALLAEDAANNGKDVPPRFAAPLAVQVSPQAYGTWETSRSGELVWRLRIQSEGAVSLNLGFARYWMPAGGRLFIYSPDFQQVRGPFTAADNEEHGQLWSPIIMGSEIVIEVDLPAGVVANLQLALTAVNHGYRTLQEASQPMSGACNLDAVCSASDGFPQVDAWREELRSSGVYTVNGTWTCSGALINNTAQDLTPYFLTANHCSVNSGNAAGVVVYWNFENSTCRPPGSPASGGAGDGQLTQFNTGAIWRASYASSDVTLIEMDDTINPDFNPFWSGWDRSNAATAGAIAIHHPNCDEKRISFENDATSITSYLGSTVPGDSTHIRITDWDLGTTEPGSSGSPLYSPERRIIGQLHGGYAACGNDSSDWYGRLFVSWTGGGTASSRLSNWLDPLNTGVTTLDGRNIVESPFLVEATPASLNVCTPNDAVYDVAVTQEVAGFVQPVDLSVFGIPGGTSALFGVNPVIPAGTSVLTITNTGAAAEGSYPLDVVGVWTTSTVTSTVTLNLYTAAPIQPGLVSPADGAVNQALAPTFEWTPGSLTGSFNFQLDESPLFDSPLATANDLLETSYPLADPLEGGRCYWWSVQGNNACGLGTWSEPFHFVTSALALTFDDDIESGAGLWTHQAATGADHWAVSTAQAHSPTHAWFVPDDSVITDSRLWNTTPILVGGGSTLTFWHRYQFEGSAWDGAVLEISTNGGGAWSDLGTYITANGYNGTISNQYSNPLADRDAWTGDLTDWTQVSVDLSSFAGQSVLIRWRLGCDSSQSDVGWYIDDVQITAPLPPNPAPTLASISPEEGSAYADTPVTIQGTGFISTPVLALGDAWLVDVTWVSSTTLTAVVPMGMAGGVYDLTLYNGDCQEATLLDAYAVIVACIPPTVTVTSDSPVDLGQPVNFTADLVGGTPPITYTWDFGGPGYGVGLDTATPVFTYTEAGTYTATVTAENGCGLDDASTLVAVNDVPPTANDDTFTVNEDNATTTLDVLANDALAPFTVGPLALVEIGSPDQGGTAVLSGTTDIRYTPAANFFGTEVFTYTILAANGLTDEAEVTVTVLSVNDLPTISAIDNQTTTVGIPVGPISFTIGDLETPTSVLTLTVESSNPGLIPAGNIVLVGSDGNRTVTITPLAGMSGTATITITVDDGTDTVSITFDVTVVAHQFIFLPVVKK